MPPRRNKIKNNIPGLVTKARKVIKGGSVHAHGCENPHCRTRYEDTCSKPMEDRPCPLCRTGHEWELLVTSRAPRDCCRAHSRPCRPEEIERYMLGGSMDWFICPVCMRTQAYDPVKADLYVVRRRVAP